MELFRRRAGATSFHGRETENKDRGEDGISALFFAYLRSCRGASRPGRFQIVPGRKAPIPLTISRLRHFTQFSPGSSDTKFYCREKLSEATATLPVVFASHLSLA